MAQTCCKHVQEGTALDHTYAADHKAGEVEVIGGTAYIVPHEMDVSESTAGELKSDGVWDVPQKAEIISADADVYWDPDGTPVLGDASSGAASAVSGDAWLGVATPTQPNGTTATAVDSNYVRVLCPNVRHRAPFVTATVAAIGAAQNNGASVTAGFTLVSAADNTKAVVLPGAAAGKEVILKNNVDKTLEVFPAVNDAINSGAANAAYTQANFSIRQFIAYDDTTWYTDPETIA